MGKRGWLHRTLHAAALLAVALLGFASSQSILMRTAPAAAGMPMCATSAPSTRLEHDRRGDATHKLCAFCDAAAHAPLCGSVETIPASAAVAWTHYAAHAGLGPRGPPEFTPQARGPPRAA